MNSTLRRLIPLLIIGLAVLATSACDSPLYQGEMQFVHTNGAELPVWVRGKVDSGVAIVYLHGGPGGSSMPMVSFPAMKSWESKYALVYWDQRLSGNNYGNAPESTLSVETMVQDTKDVVNFIQTKYHFTSLFLMGQSWGGGLSLLALADPVFQAQIKGLIDEDGAHDISLGNQLSRQWLMDYATKYLANTPSGPDAAYWQTALDWYTANPVLSSANMGADSPYWGDLNKAGAWGDQSGAYAAAADLVFSSPIALGYLENSYVGKKLAFSPAIAGSDFSPVMGAVTVPSLILWGADDGRFPVALAQDAWNKLGTPAADKSMAIFPGSGHCTMDFDANNALYAATVVNFVEKYR